MSYNYYLTLDIRMTVNDSLDRCFVLTSNGIRIDTADGRTLEKAISMLVESIKMNGVRKILDEKD